MDNYGQPTGEQYPSPNKRKKTLFYILLALVVILLIYFITIALKGLNVREETEGVMTEEQMREDLIKRMTAPEDTEGLTLEEEKDIIDRMTADGEAENTLTAEEEEDLVRRMTAPSEQNPNQNDSDDLN